MRFPPFDHLHYYEGVHGVRLNISYSNIQPFTVGEFRRQLPADLDLNWTDPSGPPELRKLIARRHGTSLDHVLVTSGATEGNFLVNAALVEPDDRVVVDSPTYSPLRDCPAGFGAKVVPVVRPCDDEWSLELGRVRRAIGARARLLVFANLNNPTSTMLSKADIRELADLAEEHDTYVLVDETFRELAFDRMPPSVVEFGPRMIALSTVTKVCGLGALRVGWIAADPAFLERCKAVKDYTTICGSSVGQLLAAWSLKRYGFFLKRARRILDRNRKVVREAIGRMPYLRGDVPDIGTVMFPHSEVDVSKLADLLLRKHRTVIAHGHFFGMEDHFRIGLGGDTDELSRGLENLRRALSALQ